MQRQIETAEGTAQSREVGDHFASRRGVGQGIQFREVAVGGVVGVHEVRGALPGGHSLGHPGADPGQGEHALRPGLVQPGFGGLQVGDGDVLHALDPGGLEGSPVSQGGDPDVPGLGRASTGGPCGGEGAGGGRAVDPAGVDEDPAPPIGSGIQGGSEAWAQQGQPDQGPSVFSLHLRPIQPQAEVEGETLPDAPVILEIEPQEDLAQGVPVGAQVGPRALVQVAGPVVQQQTRNRARSGQAVGRAIAEIRAVQGQEARADLVQVARRGAGAAGGTIQVGQAQGGPLVGQGETGTEPLEAAFQLMGSGMEGHLAAQAQVLDVLLAFRRVGAEGLLSRCVELGAGRPGFGRGGIPVEGGAVEPQGVLPGGGGSYDHCVLQEEAVAASVPIPDLFILHAAVGDAVEAPLGDGIPEPGQFQALVLAGQPRELEEAVGPVLFQGAPVGRCAEGGDVFEIEAGELPIEGPEEEEAVLDQGAAQGKAPFGGVRGALVRHVHFARVGAAVEAAPDAASEQGSLESVAAAAGDQAVHPAGREAHLGLVASRGEGLALQDLAGDVHAEPAAGAEVGGHAVHHEGVSVQHGAKHHRFRLAAGRDAGHQGRILHVAFGGEGKTFQVFHAERSLHTHGTGFGAEGTVFHHHGGGCFSAAHGQFRPFIGPQPDHLALDAVAARKQARREGLAPGVRHQPPLFAPVHRREHHRGPDRWTPLGIQHLQTQGGSGLGQGRKGGQQEGKASEQRAHGPILPARMEASQGEAVTSWAGEGSGRPAPKPGWPSVRTAGGGPTGHRGPKAARRLRSAILPECRVPGSGERSRRPSRP
ncbi:MAG: hypothetical protein BWY56_00957 [Acidobacteria bacterium ADurb.Bin340]|nr:MAG: hypothetical protein BWY56_00957 [Acidobacteria bacterium ADurb.Bin340]